MKEKGWCGTYTPSFSAESRFLVRSTLLVGRSGVIVFGGAFRVLSMCVLRVCLCVVEKDDDVQ